MVNLEDRGLKFKGWVEIVVKDKDGNVKEKRKIDNVIVKVGKAEILALMSGLDDKVFKYVAIGTGITPETDDDTKLESEVTRVQVGSITQETIEFTNDTVAWSALFTATQINERVPITEAGIFNDSEGGVMLNRTVFDVVNVDFPAGDTFTITWRVKVE